MSGEDQDEGRLNSSMAQKPPSQTNQDTNLSFPSVLHYLHSEWRRFENERNQWDLERTELHSKLSFLEGEKRGFDILKTDLLRRIKMLEYALKQERAKFMTTANSASPDLAPKPCETTTTSDSQQHVDANQSQLVKNENSATDSTSKLLTARISNRSSSMATLSKTGTARTKEILRRYLKEVGYIDKGDGNSLFYDHPSLEIPQRKHQTLSLVSAPRPFDQTPQTTQRPLSTSILSSKDITLPSDSSTLSSTAENPWGTVYSTKQQSKIIGQIQNIKEKKVATMPLASDLADLNIADDTEESSDSKSTKSEVSPRENKVWQSKFTLKGHLDGVRSIAFHPSELSLLTTSEDGTAKYWNLESIAQLKKVPVDIEPSFVYRGHRGSVNCSLVSMMIPPSIDDAGIHERMENGMAVTGGIDGSVRLWALPPKDLSPYPKYDYNSYFLASLRGHRDAIWDIKIHPIRPLLASLSADGSVRLWDMGSFDDQAINSKVFKSSSELFDGGHDIPTSLDFVHTDLKQMVVSFQNSQTKLFDIETGKVVLVFQNSDSTYDGTAQTQINKVVAHSTLPLVISGHEDRFIRFFDIRAGICTHSMTAHLDAVSTLDISPNGLVLASGGHEGSTRIWDISSHACLQEFTYHRKKFDEAIHCVKFHPRTTSGASNNSGSNVFGGSSWLATAGADSCAKVYSCI